MFGEIIFIMEVPEGTKGVHKENGKVQSVTYIFFHFFFLLIYNHRLTIEVFCFVFFLIIIL